VREVVERQVVEAGVELVEEEVLDRRGEGQHREVDGQEEQADAGAQQEAKAQQAEGQKERREHEEGDGEIGHRSQQECQPELPRGGGGIEGHRQHQAQDRTEEDGSGHQHRPQAYASHSHQKVSPVETRSCG
jgi:hypothetical protein